MARIVVIAHEHDRFATRHYMIEGLFEPWRAAGHEVLVHEGAAGAPPGDVGILHVDRTIVPEAYLAAIARYPVAVNGGTRDIGKRAVSANVVRRGDGWDGAVLVKTNSNCAGVPEAIQGQVAASREPGALRRLARGAAALLERLRAERRSRRRYPVYERASLVPGGVWDDPDLVVERFLPERDERGYYLRTWIFFGESERCNRLLGPHPVVKARDIVERVPVPVPEELRAARRRLGFDFGKLDFAVHEGKPVLYDANRTPTIPRTLTDAIKAGNRELAAGMEGFI